MKQISILLLLTSLLSCTTEKQKSPTPPNIVIIFTDDQGYQDLGCYGSPDIETPHLDQMAKEGIRFTNFYVSQPVCSASRASLLTGCYANRLGIHGAFMPFVGKGLNPGEETIAEILKPLGYATGVFGKWHLGSEEKFLPTRQGFDEYFGIPYSNDMWPHHPQQGTVFDFGDLPLFENEKIIDTLDDQSMTTTWYTDHAIDFIKKNKKQPFFLYLPHSQPHVPLFVSDKFKGKSKRGLYGDVISEIDWSVGQVLKTLKENNLDEKTLVIFASDNGPWLSYGTHSGVALPLREGKGTALEGGVRVPCIMRWPGNIPQGVTIK
ncbi:MAG: arylsulfatase A-like enzyme, partial [Saprospiraceae bacterium]